MKVLLREHDPAWASQFAAIRLRLAGALGDDALRVEHVGSTAVPGLCAKPVIDVVLVVPDSADEAAYARRLRDGGFALHHREPDWHEHRMFTLENPAANVHVFSAGCPEIERMLHFRDLLRRDARARDMYESTKGELARREWKSVQEYADAKTDVVERLLREVESGSGGGRFPSGSGPAEATA